MSFFIVFLLPFFSWGCAVLFDRGLSRLSSRVIRFSAVFIFGVFLATLAAIVAGFGDPGGPAPVALTVAMFLFIVLITATALVTPALLLDGVFSGMGRAQVMLASAVISLYFIVAFLVNPDIWAGGPEPLLSDRVPLFGWCLNAFSSQLSNGGADPVFTLLAYLGLFIEIAFVSTVIFLLVRWGKKKIQKDG
ncbi:MAG: hypothetical protein APR55_07445 [Methanolinea sp. SDB]|nr:MAG: hypothetical protein APR55_07445 [Methanolinea sp. SDB]